MCGFVCRREHGGWVCGRQTVVAEAPDRTRTDIAPAHLAAAAALLVIDVPGDTHKYTHTQACMQTSCAMRLCARHTYHSLKLSRFMPNTLCSGCSPSPPPPTLAPPKPPSRCPAQPAHSPSPAQPAHSPSPAQPSPAEPSRAPASPGLAQLPCIGRVHGDDGARHEAALQQVHAVVPAAGGWTRDCWLRCG